MGRTDWYLGSIGRGVPPVKEFAVLAAGGGGRGTQEQMDRRLGRLLEGQPDGLSTFAVDHPAPRGSVS